MTHASNTAQIDASAALARVVGIPGAVLLGLGSILGTGVFVSLGFAAGIAGPSVVWAVIAAAGVAAFNGFSSAQLAASHSVSGGTYEYGYRYLNPALGFTAGWMFLCAKSASAATAALGLAAYVLAAIGPAPPAALQRPVALAAVLAVTWLVASGMRRSSLANTLIVGVTLGSLLAFVVFGLPSAIQGFGVHLRAPLDGAGAADSTEAFLHATALMFVAYTGYGRIATLGEEVREPRRSIPRAIVITLLTSALLYAAVALVAVAAVGAPALSGSTADAATPLASIAHGFGVPAVAWLLTLGAVTAMLGVLLNLLLGLSRVVLAMARRGDLPASLASVDPRSASPRAAVFLVGALVAGLCLTGSVQTTWSFSAFTVLVYYALTNLAALRLPAESRLYPRWVPAIGLASCLGLSFWLDARVTAAGLGVLSVGLVWHRLRRGARLRAVEEAPPATPHSKETRA